MNIKKAEDALQENETAVAVFTRGLYFVFNANGEGETGNWVIDPRDLENELLNTVIVYLRKDSEGVNHIYKGTYSGYRQSSDPGRYILHFKGLQEIGVTTSNWPVFAGVGRIPVAFVVKTR